MESNVKSLDITGKWSTASRKLIDKSPSDAAFLFSLKVVEDKNCNKTSTACTDGRGLWYNPEFINSLSILQLVTLLAHEVRHVKLLHPFRLKGRNVKMANKAMDYVINLQLEKEGFVPLPDWLIDYRFENMSWEEVYSILKDEDFNKQQQQQQQQPSEPQDSNGDGDSDGDMKDSKDDDDKDSGDKESDDKSDSKDEEEKDSDDTVKDSGDKESEDESSDGKDEEESDDNDGEEESEKYNENSYGEDEEEVSGGVIAPDNVGEAEMKSMMEETIIKAFQIDNTVKKAGMETSAGMEKEIKEAAATRKDWEEELREFLTSKSPSDYSFSTPDEMFNHTGVILPSLIGETIPEIEVYFDVSGSITDAMFAKYLNSLNNILVTFNNIHSYKFYQFDTDILTKEENSVLQIGSVPKKISGGGTCYKCISDNALKTQEEKLVIVFTDGFCDSYGKDIENCVWLVYEASGMNGKYFKLPKFGKVIRIHN